jgi:uncharacterized membrane protein YebE (DUF533 family)
MANLELTQDDLKDLNDDQKSAILDALITAAWADGSVSMAEMQLFEKEVGRLSWAKSEADLLNMVDASKVRLAALKDREGVVQFIKGVAARLPAQALREKVLYTMTRLMVTDRKLDLAEQNIVGAFLAAFGIPKERFQTMVQEAVKS